MRIAFLFMLLISVAQASAEDLFESSRKALDTLRSGVTRITLDNGLRVLLYRRGFAPVFSGVVTVGVGGVDETPGESGVSHMFEHMAFKGTDTIGTKDFERERVLLRELELLIDGGRPLSSLSKDERLRWKAIHDELASLWNNEQFSREYERRGAVGLNATTDKEQTRYFVSLPRSSFEFWCWMESERLLKPVMRQFYQERNVVLEERRSRFENDPGGRLYEALLQNAFVLHPYRNPVIGYEQDLLSLTASKLDEFRQRYYVPENIVVSIVGDVDAADRRIIERTFGRLPRGARSPKPQVREPRQEAERQFAVKADAQASFIVAYHKPAYPSPEDARMTVLSEILNGSSRSPLYAQLVKKQRVAASIDNEEGPGVEYPNLLMFSVASKSPFSNRIVLRRFDEVVERFLREGGDPSLLELARRSIATDYLGAMKSNLGLATALSGAELQFGDWKALIDWYEQAIEVTMQDALDVGRRYLVRRNRTVGFLESAKGGAQ